ncbi:phosphatase and actin regulator 4-B isoform X2 [Dendroctonus ponderosae]|uniref:phosphatase and actin regulator 4-B isoform X2 n=1 Tax=Dendroctonus ponderosae TaxID=77166 RepID=UPI00203612A4|nr:phosphatase and actin regulator 4-B isoform X2 [Dendroctonus ponderosae]
MSRWHATVVVLVICLSYTTSQVPPRLQIPGAIPVGRPAPFRTQSAPPSVRLRRPNAIPSAAREVRPVVEEIEEPNYPQPSPTSAFDDEVNKLGLSLQSGARDDDEDRATPLPFRPERPVPIAREQIRDKPLISRPSAPPPRPVLRQEFRDEPQPIRQQAPVRQQISRPAPAPQTFRAAPKIAARQPAYDDEEDLRERKRKPVSQILSKYRNDNEDGSITWGFENDDGTFKEETLGADCIIRGKYGYVDPDGVKREFSYETGNKCDEPELDEEDLLPQKPNIPQSKNRPLPYRPAQPQYVN